MMSRERCLLFARKPSAMAFLILLAAFAMYVVHLGFNGTVIDPSGPTYTESLVDR